MRRVLWTVQVAIVFLLAGSLSRSRASSDWEKIGDQEGIALFRREFPESSILAVRGDAVISAPISKVASILVDSRRASEWVVGLGHSQVLRQLSNEEFIRYDRIEPPFPVQDRDFLSKVKVSVSEDGTSLTLICQSIEDSQVPATAAIRAVLIRGIFQLSKTQSGDTLVRAEVLSDPKGSLPVWAVNLFQRKMPIQLFRGLRAQARKVDIAIDPRLAVLFKE